MAGEARRLKDGRWGCAWPDCSYTHKRQDAVRLHYYAKHRREMLRQAEAAEDGFAGEPAPAAERRQVANCGRPGCAGVYRVLRQAEAAEAAALADGWRLICPICGRLSE